MKLTVCLFAMVCNVFCYSQTTIPSAFFKKGTELEYKYSLQNPTRKSKGFIPMNTIIFTVNDIEQKGDTLTSFITKRGISFNNPKDAYQKQVVFKSTSDNIYLPMDLFSLDTTYMSSVNPGYKSGIKYGVVKTLNQNYLNYPIVFSNQKDLKTGYMTAKSTMRNEVAEMAQNDFGNGGVSYINMEFKVAVTERRITGKEVVTTAAGKFDCYKIEWKTETGFSGFLVKGTYVEYFSPEVGLVKAETNAGQGQAIIELVKVK